MQPFFSRHQQEQSFFTTPPIINPPSSGNVDVSFASCSFSPQQEQEQPQVYYLNHIPTSLMELMVPLQQQRFPPSVPCVPDLKRKEEQCCIGSWIDDFDWMTDKEFMDQIFPNIITELINPDQPSPSPMPPQQEQLAVHQLPAAGSPPYQGLSLDGSDARKGAWTEDEHRRFLEGQALYPNNWKKISTDFVRTRTSTQVASHNQKFELDLAATGRKRGRRSSKNPVG